MAIKWITTINNPKDNYEEIISQMQNHSQFQFVTGQLEKGVGKDGVEGTIHLQIMTQFKRTQRGASISKIWPTSANFPVKKDNGVSDYCNKEATRLEGPWSFGEEKTAAKAMTGNKNAKKYLSEQIKLTHEERGEELTAMQYNSLVRAEAHYNLQQEPYDHPICRGIYIWGPPGTGKSHMARSYPGTKYIKPQNKWWDGYTTQETAILEDLDSNVLGHYIKIWTDRYSCTGESKGCTIQLRHKYFVMTSNYSPHQLFQDNKEMLEAILARCTVIELKAEDSVAPKRQTPKLQDYLDGLTLPSDKAETAEIFNLKKIKKN